MVKVAFFGPQLVKNRQNVMLVVQLPQVGTTPSSPSQGQQLVPSIANGSVATMLTIGGRLVGGGGDGKIVILAGLDTVEAPLLSVATAVSTKEPTGALLQTKTKIFVGQLK